MWQTPQWVSLQEGSASTEIVRALNRYFPNVAKALRPRSVVSLIYQATMTPDAGVARTFKIVATNGTAFTVANPTHPANGQDLILDLTNSSGGALGAVTLGSQYVLSTSFASPGNGVRYRYGFEYDGTNWVESWRSSAAEPSGGGGLADGDKGEIVTSGGATVFALTASGRLAERAFAPHVQAVQDVRAGANITVTRDAQGYVVAASEAAEDASEMLATRAFAAQHQPRVPDLRAGVAVSVVPDGQGNTANVLIDDSSLHLSQVVFGAY